MAAAYQYTTRVIAGVAYVRHDDYECICDLEKKAYEKNLKEINEQLTAERKERNELIIKFTAERIERNEIIIKFNAERKENIEGIEKWNELLADFEKMEKKYDRLKLKHGGKIESESESESESEEEEEIVVKPEVLSAVD